MLAGFTPSQIYAQIDANGVDSLESSPVVVDFDESIIRAYQEDESYNYFKTIDEESAWQKLKNWVNLQWNTFLEWLFSDLPGGKFWNYLATILKVLFILGVVVLIAWLFNKYYISSPKAAPEDQSEIQLSEEERLIRQKDLTTLIEEAENREDYRLASRYWFLNLLKHLKDQQLIEYQFQKTNADYKAEILNDDIQAEFTYLSRFYEFVWYGDFELKPSDYMQAKNRFKELRSLILNTSANG